MQGSAVRLAPNLAYDTPIAAADGLRYADDTDMYNGSPDRYSWKLLGQARLYIPYNNYRLSAGDVKYKDILQAGHLNRNTPVTKNTVRVVEATLKPSMRHAYSKRVLFRRRHLG